MKTLLLLVEDDYANTLKQQLPNDKAWVMPERYDAFRCALHATLESSRSETNETASLQNVMGDMDKWLKKVSS